MPNLLDPRFSYLIGFVSGDGHLSASTRNRGRLAIELAATDKEILERLQKIIPGYSSITPRTRDTNFKDAYESVILSVCGLKFRRWLVSCGIPYGNKSRIIAPPTKRFSKVDFLRGLIDADGSLGFTKTNVPFVSLVTSSDAMKDFVVGFARTHLGREKLVQRNARDDVYNLCFFAEDAQALARLLYDSPCLALARKVEAASKIRLWERPAGVKRIPNKKLWTREADQFILTHPVKVSAKKLVRTEQSIKCRLWRLGTNPQSTKVKKRNESSSSH